MSWLTEKELKRFKSVGQNVKVSREALIFGPENVELGDNVRLDAHVIVLAKKGFLKVGSHVHLAARSLFLCGGGIEIGDFAAIAFETKIVSASDDLGGEYLVGPCFTDDLTNVRAQKVTIEKFAVVAMAAIVLPGVTIGEGAVIGAQSIVRSSVGGWHVYYGSPLQAARTRSRKIEELGRKFCEQYYNDSPIPEEAVKNLPENPTENGPAEKTGS